MTSEPIQSRLDALVAEFFAAYEAFEESGTPIDGDRITAIEREIMETRATTLDEVCSKVEFSLMALKVVAGVARQNGNKYGEDVCAEIGAILRSVLLDLHSVKPGQ